MALIRYVYRLPNFIHYTFPIYTSSHFHSLCNETRIPNPNPVTNVRHLFGNHHLSFHKSTHYSDNTKFHVEPTANFETRILHPNRKFEDVDAICRVMSTCPKSAIASSLDQLGIRISSELVEEVLKKLSNAGMLALGFFRWAESKEGFRHTAQSFHHLIEALGKIKQFRLVWSLVDSMKLKGLLRKETFVLLTRRYARARKVREAIEAFEKMEMFGFKPELSDYNSLLDTISKSKHVERAQVIFSDLKRRKKVMPDLKTYSILLEGWGNEQNFIKLVEVYREMMDQGFTPDVVTCGIVIKSFCKMGKFDDALKVYNAMEQNGCKPNPHIYCTLINGLGSNKRLDEALKFFELSKTNGFPPELPTYNAVVGSYCCVAQFDNAFKVLEEMRRLGIGPNARTYDIILHHLIKANKKEVAYNVFQSMGKEEGCEPQINTYTMMVSMLCSDNRVDLALNVWKEMNAKGVLPCMHMFSTLINGFCCEDRLEEACGLFKEMLGKGIRPPGKLYGNLKEALIEAGKKDLALELGLELDKLRNAQLIG